MLKHIVYPVLLILITQSAFSQEIRKKESLNYTFIGPVVSAGYSDVKYSDWNGTEYVEETTSGPSYGAGVVLNIFAEPFCGEFQLRYTYSTLDFTLTLMEFSTAGKYLWRINNLFSAGTGLGLYLDSPPSNQSYDGSAGIMLPFTGILDLSINSKLFTNISVKYGSFGIGEDGTKLSYEINMGYLYKVGRI